VPPRFLRGSFAERFALTVGEIGYLQSRGEITAAAAAARIEALRTTMSAYADPMFEHILAELVAGLRRGERIADIFTALRRTLLAKCATAAERDALAAEIEEGTAVGAEMAPEVLARLLERRRTN